MPKNNNKDEEGKEKPHKTNPKKLVIDDRHKNILFAQAKYQQNQIKKYTDNLLDKNDIESLGKAFKNASVAEKKFLAYVFGYLPYKTNQDKLKSLKLISEMFKGAQIHIPGAEHYKKWSKYQDVISRQGKSSHSSIDEQFSIRGDCLVENLFGTRTREMQDSSSIDSKKDKKSETYSWFQLERNPAGGEGVVGTAVNIILHLIDYVIYKATGENVGPYGTSKYKETNPCYLEEYLDVPKNGLKHNENNSDFWTKFLFNSHSLDNAEKMINAAPAPKNKKDF